MKPLNLSAIQYTDSDFAKIGLDKIKQERSYLNLDPSKDDNDLEKTFLYEWEITKYFLKDVDPKYTITIGSHDVAVYGVENITFLVIDNIHLNYVPHGYYQSPGKIVINPTYSYICYQEIKSIRSVERAIESLIEDDEEYTKLADNFDKFNEYLVNVKKIKFPNPTPVEVYEFFRRDFDEIWKEFEAYKPPELPVVQGKYNEFVEKLETL